MTQELQTSLSVLGIGIAIILSLLLVAVFSQRVGERFSPKDGLPEAVRAKVVARREHIGADDQGTPFTEYFITFELYSGERIEMMVPDDKYGLIVERDQGKLRYDKEHFISFERK